MYYYGYNNGYSSGGQNYYQNPCCTNNNNGFLGYSQGGYGFGAAMWIVLFILLVIIIGAGWAFGGNNQGNM